MIAKQGLPRLFAAAGLAVALILPLAAPTAAAEDPPQNAVELRVSDVEYQEAGRYGQFTYTRESHDLSGQGAKIRHGRVCYSSGGCISAPLEYVVEPGGVLVQEGQLLMPMSQKVPETFNLHFPSPMARLPWHLLMASLLLEVLIQQHQ